MRLLQAGSFALLIALIAFFLGDAVAKNPLPHPHLFRIFREDVEPTSVENSARIQRLLTRQAADWNRGDLDAFATGYKKSPDILFIGSRTSYGYDGMLAGYKQHYATREAMGTLTFSQLQVQPLDAQFATATGHYHLERTAAGGGNADGYFLLVLEDTPAGWKIVRDDTTALPPPAKP